MKARLLLVLFVILAFNACKKNAQTVREADGKKYKLTFNLSGFIQTVTPVANTTRTQDVKATDLGTSITELKYLVYKKGGSLIHYVSQKSTDANFGLFSENLPSGEYVIYFAGASGLFFVDAGKNVQEPFLTLPQIISESVNYDVFFKKLEITVGNEDIVQDITLKRILSKVTVKILDALPSNSNNLNINIDNIYTGYSFYFEAPGSVVSGKDPNTSVISPNQGARPGTYKATIPQTAIGQSNFTRSFVFATTAAATHGVSISVKDVSGSVLGSTAIQNINLAPNTNTTLSGNLFLNGGGADINLNKQWNTPIKIDF